MDMNQPILWKAASFMQPIDVLGHQKPDVPALSERRHSQVGGIGGSLADQLPSFAFVTPILFAGFVIPTELLNGNRLIIGPAAGGGGRQEVDEGQAQDQQGARAVVVQPAVAVVEDVEPAALPYSTGLCTQRHDFGRAGHQGWENS